MDGCSPEEDGDPQRRGAQARSGERRRILLVDDDDDMRSLLSDVLSDEGYEVVHAKDGAEALLFVHREAFSAILLDKKMPGLSGLDLLPGLRVICPHTPIIVITAFGDPHTAAEVTEKGACGCLFKPFRMDELSVMLRRALAEEKRPAGISTCQG
jgi:DNA-binding NtrC family response regulator